MNKTKSIIHLKPEDLHFILNYLLKRYELLLSEFQNPVHTINIY
jgi:hypothetical protein